MMLDLLDYRTAMFLEGVETWLGIRFLATTKFPNRLLKSCLVSAFLIPDKTEEFLMESTANSWFNIGCEGEVPVLPMICWMMGGLELEGSPISFSWALLVWI
jgi:hypothetical protein